MVGIRLKPHLLQVQVLIHLIPLPQKIHLRFRLLLRHLPHLILSATFPLPLLRFPPQLLKITVSILLEPLLRLIVIVRKLQMFPWVIYLVALLIQLTRRITCLKTFLNHHHLLLPLTPLRNKAFYTNIKKYEESGSPVGIRTPTKGTKNLCATITPPGYDAFILLLNRPKSRNYIPLKQRCPHQNTKRIILRSAVKFLVTEVPENQFLPNLESICKEIKAVADMGVGLD